MAVNVAFTVPVNKPTSDTILTAEDVWRGIVISVRQPEMFVDYISKTEIFDDTGVTLRRVLHFKPNGSHNAPGGKLEQSVTIVPDLKVEFVAAATGKATMSVSLDVNESEEESQVYITQAFEVAYPPGVEAASEKALGQYAHLSKVARANIVSMVQSLRDLKEKNV